MQFPDISGYKLDNALEELRARGMENIRIRLTSSPRRKDAGYNGNSRVVRINKSEDGITELLVCNIE